MSVTLLVTVFMAKQLFGTDGIRGRANQYPITSELALRLGRAISRVFPSSSRKKVLIGRDTRASGIMLESAICAGLLSEGVDVYLVGVLPTPAVSYLTSALGCDAGVMLTASHNPHMDNGIKIFGADGYKLNDEVEELVEGFLLSEEALEAPLDMVLGQVIEVADAAERYTEFTKRALADQSLAGLKIVIDCAHGAAYQVGPKVFKELGAEVVTVGVEPDGRNINEGVGAMHPEYAASLVKSAGADLGLCLDGDADRLILVDGGGNVVSGDRVLCLSAMALKESGQLEGDTLVATVMSNLGLKVALESAGIDVVQTAVGDRHVIECMREHGYSLGGENSGHVIFSDYATTGDGIMSALMVMAFMKRGDKTLAELADCMEEFSQELHALAVKEKPPIEELPSLVEAIRSTEEVLGERGRVLVRYSGTEKKMRVLVEAQDSVMASEEAAKICAVVAEIIGE